MHRFYRAAGRLLIGILALGMLLSFQPAAYAAETNGSCGADLTWSLDGDCLTITGSGDMTDFPESTMAPWYEHRAQIRKLSLPEGLTGIGCLAFYGCENLTVAAIPDGVTHIGSYAFAGCSGMTILDLGNGVRSIGQSAFSDCVSLSALQLPEGLVSIGAKAFYRCEGIAAVTVPTGVESLGASAFSYCKSLVQARVNAPLTEVPELLFYGCHRLTSVTLPDELEQLGDFSFRGCQQLTTVYYGGSSVEQETLQELIGTDVPGFQGTGYVTDGTPGMTESSGTTQENGDGTILQENLTASQSSNMTGNVIMETVRQEDGQGKSASMLLQITIENDQGWKEAQELVTQALKDYNSNTAQLEDREEKIQLHLFIKNGEPNQEFVELIAQRQIAMTISTRDGSQWRLDGTALEAVSQGCDLRYTLKEAGSDLREELKADRCYILRFHASAQINAEVLLWLGSSVAHQSATLLCKGEELTQVQTTVVDQQGNAHFYLASVSKDVDYYVAVNFPEADQEAVVPDELLSAYGQPIRLTPIEYQITGVTSSLGVTSGQFTWILTGVLVGCVVIVGVIVYMFHKRKVKMEKTPEENDREI